jgi:Xaa-Pro aminopeptidase
MDFKGRLERAREQMRERGIGLMYLTRGANLWYLTGIRRRGPELTDSNAYGDYVCGAYIGADGGFTLVGPRMGGAGWRSEADGKTYVEEVVIFDEHRRPADVMEGVLRSFDVGGKGISVDDRAWTQTSLLIRELQPGSELTLASDIVAPMRMIKDADEVALMKEAGEITDEVYGDVVAYLKVGVTEYDVAHEVDYQFAKRGVEYNSFVTGVRFSSPRKPRQMAGPRSSPRKLEEGDSISFDFGACYQGYCSDFGRTVFIGDPSEEFLKIHDLVMEAQSAAIEKMVDGTITATGLDRVARGIIEDAGYGECFVHRLGHGIGVTVHEPPFLYIPDETVLRSGMTFTVEPSILLPGSWSARVEDVVMVTEKGGVPFSHYSKELTVI